jgi:signal peptidase I
MQMYFDFSAILTFATLISGSLWAIDSFIFKPKRVKEHNNNESSQEADKEPKLIEYCRSFFPILLIVLLLRAFVAEPFRIPSGSMKPSLLEGDFILVNKYTYGLRLPVFGTKVLSLNNPKRGDVLVFRFPGDTSINFIKRVIAIPGDTVSYKDNVLKINGKIIEMDYLDTEHDLDPIGRVEQLKRYNEKLEGKSHYIYKAALDRLVQDEITVPEGKYFVMGDNRDNSEDSRAWGFVPDNLILGKGSYVWFSWDSKSTDVRWNRMLTKIN